MSMKRNITLAATVVVMLGGFAEPADAGGGFLKKLLKVHRCLLDPNAALCEQVRLKPPFVMDPIERVPEDLEVEDIIGIVDDLLLEPPFVMDPIERVPEDPEVLEVEDIIGIVDDLLPEDVTGVEVTERTSEDVAEGPVVDVTGEAVELAGAVVEGPVEVAGPPPLSAPAPRTPRNPDWVEDDRRVACVTVRP